MKRQGFYPVSPYKQPLPQFQPQQILHGLDEEVDYLPGTHIRVWFTHLPTAYPPHRHDCLEIIEGIHSHYTCQIGEQTYTVAPEDILLIPPGTVHDLTPAANCNGWIYLCDLSWVHSIPTSRGLQPVLSQPTFVSRLTQPTLYMTLAGHLSHMRSVYFSADSDRELLFDAELLLMLSGLRTAFASTGEIGPLDKRRVHEALFRQVVEFIELNYARDLLVNETDMAQALSSGKVRKYMCDFANPHTLAMENTVVTPHLGASTEESEENCAIMAVEEVANYMEHGNIINSVTFPRVDKGVPARSVRLGIFYKNADVLSVIREAVGEDVTGAMRGNYGYAIADLDELPDLGRLEAIEGVYKIRRIRG